MKYWEVWASFPTERVNFPVPFLPFQSQSKLYTSQTAFWTIVTYFWIRVTMGSLLSASKSGKVRFTSFTCSEMQNVSPALQCILGWIADVERISLEKWIGPFITSCVPSHWVGMEMKKKPAWWSNPLRS